MKKYTRIEKKVLKQYINYLIEKGIINSNEAEMLDFEQVEKMMEKGDLYAKAKLTIDN